MTKYSSFLDKCKTKNSGSQKLWCDYNGMHIDYYKTKDCKATDKVVAQSKLVHFGECYKNSKGVTFVVKGAETLKLAISGAALAFVAL